jgi:beta-glucosidase/6-phospho-beta-glucosidase/beta-galactosidase
MHRYPLVQPHVHGQTEADPSLRWKCIGNLLKAHGRAVEVFRQLKANHTINAKAKISYKNAGAYNVPYRKHDKLDQAALKRGMSFDLDLFARPIHLTGDYPIIVKEEVPRAWLPQLSKEDIKRIKGSADFFATVSTSCLSWSF